MSLDLAMPEMWPVMILVVTAATGLVALCGVVCVGLATRLLALAREG